MHKILFVTCFVFTSAVAASHELPLEIHQTLVTHDAQEKIAALTLDACGGEYDARMMAFLIEQKIPATLFITKRWLDKNPVAFAEIKSHPELFEIETHGARHIPAVVGKDRHVFGIAGSPDLGHLKQEVDGGAQAVEKLGVTKPTWYRGATAMYDSQAIAAIKNMGYKIAGFSVNADNGATLSKRGVIARLKSVKSGDIIIAHMNKPRSHSADGMISGVGWLLQQGFRFVKLNNFGVRELPN